MKNKAMIIARSLGVAALILASSTSAGMEYLLESELRVSAQHDDNINLEMNSKNSVFGEIVNPKAKIIMRSENWSSNINADLRFSDFNRSGYSSNDQYLTLNSKYQGERYDFSVAANATNDTTRTSEGLDSGRFSNSRHHFYSISPSWSYYVNNRNTLTLQSNLQRTEFDADYIGNKYGKAYVQWTYKANEQLQLFLGGNGSITRFDEVTKPDLFVKLVPSIIPGFYLPQDVVINQALTNETKEKGFQLGASYQWTEQLNLYGVFGRSSTVTSVDVKDNPECSDPQWYLVGSLCNRVLPDSRSSNKNAQTRITWQEERQQFNLGYSREINPSSNGFVLEYEQVDLGWKYKITETGTVSLKGTWLQSKEISQPDGVTQSGASNRDYTTITAGYSHRLTTHWFVNADLRYQQQKREIYTGVAENFSGRLGITYIPDKLQW